VLISIIDYRCEDGRFPVSAACVTIKPRLTDLLYSSEIKVITGIEAEETTHEIELNAG
jgi:hypothetical protein